MPDRFARVPAAPVAADPAAEVLALLRQIAADLHILAAGRRPDLCEADRAALADLLPAIARAVGTRFAWTARELTAHAVKADAALLAAIENATGPLDGTQPGALAAYFAVAMVPPWARFALSGSAMHATGRFGFCGKRSRETRLSDCTAGSARA